MNSKEKLTDFLKEKNDELINIIQTKLKDDEIEYAIQYIEKLNTISNHKITKIGHTVDGNFYVNCETGFTYIK